MPERTFAIGDIHGCDVALRAILDQIDVTPDDRVIVLGDFVDRGPSTRRTIDLLLQLKSQCELVWLKGNHEEMMLEAAKSAVTLRNWLMMGGREALASYGDELRNVPETHWEFISASRDYFETDTEIYLHANLEPGIALGKQDSSWLRWIHLTGMEYPHESGKRIICGHTQQRSGIPLFRDGWVCLDTGAYRGNPLTCLHVETDICYRADQQGRSYPPVMLGESVR